MSRKKDEPPTLTNLDRAVVMHRLTPNDHKRINEMVEDLGVSLNLNRSDALELLAAIGILMCKNGSAAHTPTNGSGTGKTVC
jgi:hypothetical protein